MTRYDDQGITALEVLTAAQNYNEWIGSEVKSHLIPPVLEVGAGIGNLTKFCLEKKPIFITDSDPKLVKELEERFGGRKNIFVKLLDVSQRRKREFEDFFGSVYAINVLEHIDNDRVALGNIFSMMKGGGKLVVLVPAKRFAYSRLDRDLGHFRRYERKELREKLESAGFEIDSLKFFNIVGLFSWWARDKIARRNINLKPYQIKIFDRIVPLLSFIEKRVKVPLGISLIAVARKRVVS